MAAAWADRSTKSGGWASAGSDQQALEVERAIAGYRSSFRDNRARAVVFVLAIALIAGLHLAFLSMKVRAVPADPFNRFAFELKSDDVWRYGFTNTRHGAFLVKTRKEHGLSSEPARRRTNSPDSRVRGIMMRELELVSRKAGWEMALYVVVLGLVVFGRPWLLQRFSKEGALVRSLLIGLGLRSAAWTILLLPLAFDYGTPLYTTAFGPGALSSSTSFPSWGNGMCISYRYVVENAALLPFALARPVARVLQSDFARVLGLDPIYDDRVWIWLLGLAFYGAIGFVSDIGQFPGVSSEERP